MIILQKNTLNNNNNNSGTSNSNIIASNNDDNTLTSINTSISTGSLLSSVKRLSLIDRGKVWAKQLINKKLPLQHSQSFKSTLIKQDNSKQQQQQQQLINKNKNENLLTISTASLLLSLSSTPTSCSPIIKSPSITTTSITNNNNNNNNESSTASSLSLITTTTTTSSSQTPSPISLSPISINKNKRISLIQVSPQNYYFYQHDICNNLNNNNNNNNNNSSTPNHTSSPIQSPQDENGYLIPLTIIDLSNINNKINNNKNSSGCNSSGTSKLVKKNIQNIRRQSSMKVESRFSKKKDSRIQLRKKSFNGKDDLINNNNNNFNDSNLKQFIKNRRFSDLSFSNQQISPSTSTSNSQQQLPSIIVGTQHQNQQLYNITERNNETSKFDDLKRNLNDYVDNSNKKCLLTNSKIILLNNQTSSSNIINKNNIVSSDDSIIYIDSIDNLNNDNTSNDTSSFMTTASSSSSSSSSCCCSTSTNGRCNNNNNQIEPSLKIHVHDDDTKNGNHDYHAIDECKEEFDFNISKINNKNNLLPPLLPPPPPPPPPPLPQPPLLTNNFDNNIKQQKNKKIIDENCYEKSWENSTNFLIDKLLNKFNNNNNENIIINSNNSGTSSTTTSNRNSTTINFTNIQQENLLFQTQQLLINTYKQIQSPTNTISSTNSLKNSKNNNYNLIKSCILLPPQIPPPPLPVDVKDEKRKSLKNRDECRQQLIRLSNNYDDNGDLIIFNDCKYTPSIRTNTLDSKKSFSYSDSDNNDFDDPNEIWYQPNISRDAVQNILSTLEVGAFLIRFSNSCKDCFALSIRVPYFANPTGVAHYLIIKNDNGYKLKGVEKEFKSLKSLVTHYSVMQEILPVTLNLNFTLKNTNLIGNQCLLTENHTKQIIDNLIK